jgi:hypothetical protein
VVAEEDEEELNGEEEKKEVDTSGEGVDKEGLGGIRGRDAKGLGAKDAKLPPPNIQRAVARATIANVLSLTFRNVAAAGTFSGNASVLMAGINVRPARAADTCGL